MRSSDTVAFGSSRRAQGDRERVPGERVGGVRTLSATQTKFVNASKPIVIKTAWKPKCAAIAPPSNGPENIPRNVALEVRPKTWARRSSGKSRPMSAFAVGSTPPKNKPDAEAQRDERGEIMREGLWNRKRGDADERNQEHAAITGAVAALAQERRRDQVGETRNGERQTGGGREPGHVAGERLYEERHDRLHAKSDDLREQHDDKHWGELRMHDDLAQRSQRTRPPDRGAARDESAR